MGASSQPSRRELKPEEFRELFLQEVHAAADELFSGVKPSFAPRREVDDVEFRSAGMVGFVSSTFQGSIVVAIKGLESLRTRLYEDWVGELANQLSGRVKNRLLRHRLPPYDVSPQVTIRGRELEPTRRSADETLCYCSSSPAGDCCIWVTLVVRDTVPLAPHADPPETEGSVILF